MATAIVVIGGVPEHQVMPPPRALAAVEVVIAADSGWDLAVSLGLSVDVIVGDLDSISEAGLAAAEAAEVVIDRHPVDKESTDLELALAAALGGEIDHIVVIGGEGGRFDHLVGNVSVLASPRFAAVAIEAWIGDAYVTVVRDRWTAAVRPCATISILPWQGPAALSVSGVRWPLRHEVLVAGTSRGISNEADAAGAAVEIEVDDGVVMVLIPDSEDVR